MSGFEGRDAVAGYLASKGLPMTGENVRRALEQNAANPGLIKGLVNQAPPPPDSSNNGAGTSSNQPGSAAADLSQRMHQSAPQEPQAQLGPQAASDSATNTPVASSGGSSGGLGALAALILGGGGYGLSRMFGGGSGSAPTLPQSPVEGVKPFSGVASPMPPALSSPVVSGVDPIGPPQPGRMPVGPSSPIPGVAEMANAATHNPGAMDWGKILGDLAHVVRR